MAHQSARNLKKRVSHLSRRINKTSQDLRGLAKEVGEYMHRQQVQVMSGLGLTDCLVSVMENTIPGLTDQIKAEIKSRAEQAKAARVEPVPSSQAPDRTFESRDE